MSPTSSNGPAPPSDADSVEDIPLDDVLAALADHLMPFREAVYAVVRCVPRGRVLGYGHVAGLMGSPRAARQVGFALAALPLGTLVPWWRVIRSNGTIALQGDPNRGPAQVEHLQAEGVTVVAHKVDMKRYQWNPHERP